MPSDFAPEIEINASEFMSEFIKDIKLKCIRCGNESLFRYQYINQCYVDNYTGELKYRKFKSTTRIICDLCGKIIKEEFY